MFNANAVSNALTLTSADEDDERTIYNFACNVQVQCSGDARWGYTRAGDTVTVTGISVHEERADDDVYYNVNVTLAEERVVYTDEAFAQAVSALLNMQVDYTEQGMQDYSWVSMEA